MSTATGVPVEGHSTSSGDAPVMHGAIRATRRSARSLMTVESDGASVKTGTVVIGCRRPQYVGQVTRVTADGRIHIRWWNTETLEVSTTIELPDSGLIWLVA